MKEPSLSVACVTLQGRMPGGVTYEPPMATGLGDWDFVGGFVGEGGIGSAEEVKAGNHGGVRLILPGYYYKKPYSNDRTVMYRDVVTDKGAIP